MRAAITYLRRLIGAINAVIPSKVTRNATGLPRDEISPAGRALAAVPCARSDLWALGTRSNEGAVSVVYGGIGPRYRCRALPPIPDSARRLGVCRWPCYRLLPPDGGRFSSGHLGPAPRRAALLAIAHMLAYKDLTRRRGSARKDGRGLRLGNTWGAPSVPRCNLETDFKLFSSKCDLTFFLSNGALKDSSNPMRDVGGQSCASFFMRPPCCRCCWQR